MKVRHRGKAVELLGLLHMEIDEVFCAFVFSFAPLSFLLLLMLLMTMKRTERVLQAEEFLLMPRNLS